MGRAALLLLLFVFVACPAALAVGACGGGSSEAKSAQAPASDAGPAAPSEGTAGDLASSKAAFVAECSKENPGTEEYCGCAWDVARQTYGDDAVRAKGTPSNDDLAKIHVKVSSACASKFPPEVIERAFMAGCTKKQPEMQQYCACSWQELSKKMPAGELMAERAKGSEKYQSAMHASANACGKLRPAR